MSTITESVADRLSGGQLTELRAQASQLVAERDELAEINLHFSYELEMVKENLTRLEQALNSGEWRLMSVQADQEFSRQGMRQIVDLARIMRLKNPIIGRRVDIQKLYVWGQGVNISARDPGVNEVVQAFLDDERNQAILTTQQQYGQREVDLQQDANLFFAFFTNPLTGRVRVRTIDVQEIDDIICNPDDKYEPWFYRRCWTPRKLDGSPGERQVAYYPDWRFMPRSKLAFTELLAAQGGVGGRIVWETPVYHVLVNPLGRWGVTEYYSALDWALAYKSFLEDLATVWRSLARWAWELKTKGGKTGIAAAKDKLNTGISSMSGETNPPPLPGSTFIKSDPDVALNPIKTAGATMSASDGRQLHLMAIAEAGYPESFYGDVSVGTLATAESLDRPTELKIMARQGLWKTVLGNILSFAVLQAVKAPQGALRNLGRVVLEPDGNEVSQRIAWKEGVDPAVEVTFPAIVEKDLVKQIGALVDATTLKGGTPAGTLSLQIFTKRALSELGFDDVDSLMEELFPGGEVPGMPEMDDEQKEMLRAVRDLLGNIRESLNGHKEEIV